MNSSDDSCTMEIATSKMCRTRAHKSTFQQQSNCTFITAILFLVISINSCHCSTAVPSGAQSAVLSVPGIQGGTGQIPLVRLPSNTLLKYTAYKDVSILHFRIPTDTRTAIFSFKAYEETKSAFQLVCQPKDVTLHLKAGSYPVISPENITFPRHFLNADQRFEIHNLQFKSDGTTKRLSIDGPNPGNWFAVAFISWTDPSNDRIEQQGLAASCETLLLAEMSVIRLTPITLNERILHTDTLTSNTSTPMSFKIFAPRNLAAITWQLNLINTCDDCPDISFKIQAHGLPSANTYLQSAIIYTNRTGEVSIEFHPHRNAWHYIDLEFIDGDNSSGGGSVEGMGDGETSDPIDSSSSSSTTSKPNTLRNNETDYQVEFSIQTTFHYDNTDDEFDEEDDDDISSSSSSPTSTNNNSGNNNENNNDVDVEMGQEKATDDKVSPLRSIKYSPLLRQTYREFFMFDYDLIPEGNGTAPVYLNITAGTPAGFRFDVGDVYDIGGTLSFAMAMKDNLKGAEVEHPLASGAIAEKLVDTSGGAEQSTNNLARSNQTIIICMRLGEPGIPTWPDKCVYGRHTFPAASIVNNTNEDTSTGLVHVPFPESGTWYVTLGLYCHGFETAARTTIIDSVKDFIHQHVDLMHEMKNPCACANQTTYFKKCINEKLCLDSMNETETLKVKECLMDSKCTKRYQEMSTKFEMHHKFATEQSVATDSSCNGSIVFTISSSPCVAGRCGRYGRCYHYMSGGFVFSTCLCIKGYRGWDCTEDTQVPSSFSILLASLLLTLSNLLFIPSIYFAVRRQYFTEAVIYFFAMFFSIFYHACDSGEDEYSFCLVKIGVLQFCDFYCGLLAIWVTLIAMANIRQALVSLLHMLGAIMLAFGTELNKQSLWVFLAPALTGICIISASWGLRCRKTRKWFPSRKYLAIFMPIGTVLVMVGLVCYAFLQTKQNYHIVHSIWHMVMALSILCLLPSRKSFLPKC